MVTKTMADSTYSSYRDSSSTMSSSASAAPTSWSKLFGSQKKRTYKTSYGRVNSYESTGPSSLQQSFSRSGGVVGRSYSSSRYDSDVPRHRTSASVDRDLERSVQRAETYAEEARVSRSAYRAGQDYVNSGRRRYSVSVDRNIGRTLTTDREYSRASSYSRSREPSSERSTPGYVLGYASAHTDSNTVPRVRASSMSRYERALDYTPPIPTRSRRSASISRVFRDDDEESVSSYGRSRELSTSRRSASISRYMDYENEVEVPRRRHYNVQQGYEQVENASLHQEVGQTKGDISGYVIRPGQSFEPNDVSVCVLPSGKKAVTYTQSSQSGSGDQSLANQELERVIQRTKFLQDSMYTLEAFVKRNRSYFPEETMIYQSINFFQLNEEQLREIGESPDAIVFGVKIKERLVVPKGCDVSHILKRYYGKQTNEYEVEYEDRDKIRYDAEEQQQNQQNNLQQDIRKQVEQEWDNRYKAKLLGDESFEVKEANRSVDSRDRYKHLHPHMTQEYIRSYYVDAGLDYDSIYSQRSSRGSEASGDHESIRTQSSMSSAKKKRFDASPQFMTKLRGKKCHEGTTVKFNCSVSGLPLPDVIWFKNNTMVSDGPRHKVSNNYGLLSLEIKDTQRDDTGLYTVKAINVEGEITCSAPLDVQEIQLEERVGVKRRPYFLSEALNTWAEVGQKAVFEAQATGRPMPTFRWQRDNITVSEDARCRIFSDESGNSKLVIKEVQSGDAGLYYCVAENKEGKAKCAASLRVVEKGVAMDQEPPRRRRSVSQEPMLRMSREGTPLFEIPAPVEKGTKPWFIKLPPTEVTAFEGDPITIRCILDGDPKPKVTWNKGVRELIYTKRHRVIQEGDHYLMQIKSSIQTDPGEYTVMAENSCGRIKASIWVNLKPRPAEDDDPEFRRSRFDLPDYEYNVLTETDLLRMAPRFTKKLPRESEVSEGSSVEVTCKVQEGEALEYLSGVKITRKVVEKSPLPTDKDTDVIDLKSVQEGDPPTIVTSLSDKSGKPGGIIKLTIQLNKCQPPPTVTWFKEGKDISDDDRYELFADGDTYNCEICDTEADDSGNYSITATNGLGTASCFCTVTIKDGDQSVPVIVVDECETRTEDVGEEAKPEAETHEPAVEATEVPEVSSEEPAVSQEVAQKVEVIADKIAEDIVVEAVQEAPFREAEALKEAAAAKEITVEFEEPEKEEETPVVVVKEEVTPEESPKVEAPKEESPKAKSEEKESASEVESEEEESDEEEMEESEEAAVLIIEEAEPIAAPTVESTLTPCRVNEGETAKFEAKISGEDVKVVWSLNDNEVTEGETEVMTEVDGVYSLSLSTVQPEDEGPVTIMASNSAGSVTSTAQLTVQAAPEAETKSETEEETGDEGETGEEETEGETEEEETEGESEAEETKVEEVKKVETKDEETKGEDTKGEEETESEEETEEEEEETEEETEEESDE